jgi:hypothetical protein
MAAMYGSFAAPVAVVLARQTRLGSRSNGTNAYLPFWSSPRPRFRKVSVENDRKLEVCGAVQRASVPIHFAVARARPPSHVKACSHLQNMLSGAFLIDLS